MPKAASFSKPTKRGFSRPDNLFGVKPKQEETPFKPLPSLEKALDLRDPKEAQLANTLGSEKLAKRIIFLQKTYPQGSVPELLVLDWLEAHNVTYQYQVALYGGRGRKGGLIPDFLINNGGQGLALEVQGNYWHGGFAAQEEDLTAKMRMMGAVVSGLRIDAVVEVWESRLLRDRDHTMMLAVAGVETGK